MTRETLIRWAQVLKAGTEVMILDGLNEGGFLREINYKNVRVITENDAKESSDCDELVGKPVAILGFGRY